MIAKLDEENAVHRYLLNDKLPKEIDTKRASVQHMSKVVTQPAMDKQYVDKLKQEVK